MPKRILLLSGLVVALLAMSSIPAQASPFQLTLSDGTNTVTIQDNGAADLQAGNDMIQVNATVGSFTITGLITTILNGTSGVPVQMSVGTMTVKSQAAGTLTATLWRHDLNPAALGLGSNVVLNTTSGATVGTANPAGNVEFTNSIDADNGNAGTPVFNTMLPGSPATGTASFSGLGPGNFALVSQLEFNFISPTAAQINASGNVKVTNGATPVPEPTTLLLFGPGMLGLLGLGRHRRRSKAV